MGCLMFSKSFNRLALEDGSTEPSPTSRVIEVVRPD